MQLRPTTFFTDLMKMEGQWRIHENLRLNSTTRARPDPHDPDLRETPLGPCGSPTKSVRVRSGLCIVEFSLYSTRHRNCARARFSCRFRVSRVHAGHDGVKQARVTNIHPTRRRSRSSNRMPLVSTTPTPANRSDVIQELTAQRRRD